MPTQARIHLEKASFDMDSHLHGNDSGFLHIYLPSLKNQSHQYYFSYRS